jgi:hypothetical protein
MAFAAIGARCVLLLVHRQELHDIVRTVTALSGMQPTCDRFTEATTISRFGRSNTHWKDRWYSRDIEIYRPRHGKLLVHRKLHIHPKPIVTRDRLESQQLEKVVRQRAKS